jgi:hypothetical protein
MERILIFYYGKKKIFKHINNSTELFFERVILNFVFFEAF